MADMTENKPIWVELSSTNPAASRAFYTALFDWKVEVNPDPQYGGYALAKIGGKDVAGIGGKQPGDPTPTNWTVYIGIKDADSVARKVTAAGGKVIAPPFDVGDQGRMAIIQDPAGAFLGIWQPKAMAGFHAGPANTFGWAELNSRGLGTAVPFYQSVFGWAAKKSEAPAAGQPPYTEFQLGGESLAGGMDMNPMVPAAVPSYWMAYFNVGDVDSAFKKATAAGAKEMMAPQDFPGGRFAIVSDPQGAAFGLMQMAEHR